MCILIVFLRIDKQSKHKIQICLELCGNVWQEYTLKQMFITENVIVWTWTTNEWIIFDDTLASPSACVSENTMPNMIRCKFFLLLYANMFASRSFSLLFFCCCCENKFKLWFPHNKRFWPKFLTVTLKCVDDYWE